MASVRVCVFIVGLLGHGFLDRGPRGRCWAMASSTVDHAVAAFIEDVKQRGLSDKILLIVTGEMGRTPKLNKNGGRDHYGNLTPLILAGGGLKMGQVIGKSDATGSKPTTKVYKPANLFSTVMNFLLDNGKLRLRPDLHRDIKATIENNSVIEDLF